MGHLLGHRGLYVGSCWVNWLPKGHPKPRATNIFGPPLLEAYPSFNIPTNNVLKTELRQPKMVLVGTETSMIFHEISQFPDLAANVLPHLASPPPSFLIVSCRSGQVVHRTAEGWLGPLAARFEKALDLQGCCFGSCSLWRLFGHHASSQGGGAPERFWGARASDPWPVQPQLFGPGHHSFPGEYSASHQSPWGEFCQDTLKFEILTPNLTQFVFYWPTRWLHNLIFVSVCQWLQNLQEHRVQCCDSKPAREWGKSSCPCREGCRSNRWTSEAQVRGRYESLEGTHAEPADCCQGSRFGCKVCGHPPGEPSLKD